jgi:hypothetical protein
MWWCITLNVRYPWDRGGVTPDRFWFSTVDVLINSYDCRDGSCWVLGVECHLDCMGLFGCVCWLGDLVSHESWEQAPPQLVTFSKLIDAKLQNPFSLEGGGVVIPPCSAILWHQLYAKLLCLFGFCGRGRCQRETRLILLKWLFVHHNLFLFFSVPSRVVWLSLGSGLD